MRLLPVTVLACCSFFSPATRPTRLSTESNTTAICKDGADECGEGCNVKGALIDGKAKIPTAYFFDFDGTTELFDLLAHAVMWYIEKQGCGLSNPNGDVDSQQGTPYDANGLITALTHVVSDCWSETNTAKLKDITLESQHWKHFIATYFQYVEDQVNKDKKNRLDQLREGIKRLHDAGHKAFVLSASWRAIPLDAWQGYLDALVKKLGLNFDKVYAINDAGTDRKSNKGKAVVERCAENGMAHCVHIDNSADYILQTLSMNNMEKSDNKYGGVFVKTGISVNKETFDILLKDSPPGCTVPEEYGGDGDVWDKTKKKWKKIDVEQTCHADDSHAHQDLQKSVQGILKMIKDKELSVKPELWCSKIGPIVIDTAKNEITKATEWSADKYTAEGYIKAK